MNQLCFLERSLLLEVIPNLSRVLGTWAPLPEWAHFLASSHLERWYRHEASHSRPYLCISRGVAQPPLLSPDILVCRSLALRGRECLCAQSNLSLCWHEWGSWCQESPHGPQEEELGFTLEQHFHIRLIHILPPMGPAGRELLTPS